MRIPIILVLLVFFLIPKGGWSQGAGEDALGAWYMYFYSAQFKDGPWGVQGDFQYRDWQIMGDREQLLLRSGFTYRPTESRVLFTLGYGNVTTGRYGKELDQPTSEHRIYQEALITDRILELVHLTHRFRYEQRWVEDQNFRTRFRYNLFINIPLNQRRLEKGALYIALYNEFFINGEFDIGNDRQVQYFDRNRIYLGAGYALGDDTRVQLGWMQQTTVSWQKRQLQFSLHQRF